MPLILIAGNPCTGKTTFANKLVDYLKSRGVSNIELINEEHLKITKQSGYKTSFNEKSTRGLLKSAADHKLNTECYVIVDSLNYIKGFRYELYCSARTFRTPHCVVWVECDENDANTWNSERMELTGDGYDDVM
jgi:protein KTI12